VANWELIGEVTISNSPQTLNTSIIGDETFRITTTILNQPDWDTWKFKSGAYLTFSYALDGYTKPYYIKVTSQPTIYEFPIPTALKSQGVIIRFASIVRASRYLPLTPNDNFAQWAFKLESLDQPPVGNLDQIAADLAAIKELIGG
jgi:hypothetical protein